MLISRTESFEIMWTAKYFNNDVMFAEIINPTLIHSSGEKVLFNNKKKVISEIIWNLEEFEIYIYLKDENEND